MCPQKKPLSNGLGAEHRDSAAQQTWQLPQGYFL